VTVADAVSLAELVELVAASSLQLDVGLDLLDSDDRLIEDISADLVASGGVVERDAGASIHGTCRLAITRDLQWGSQRLRPWMRLSSSAWSARWNLGVFLPATPERRAGETPATFEVTGFDKLSVLNVCHGSSYSAAAGAAPLTLVADLLAAAGESAVAIDQAGAGTVLPARVVWPFEASTTTLGIVNDLLLLAGYRSLWCDRDGVYRSEPDRAASERAVSWWFDADDVFATTVTQRRMMSADFFAAPNRWVFVRNDPAQAAPTEGAGMFTVVNQSDGPTSVDARGRTISTVVRLDAADQAALVTQGNRIVEAGKKVARRLSIGTSPVPALWHGDVVTYADAALGLSGSRWLVTGWRLPLDGGDMALEMTEVQT